MWAVQFRDGLAWETLKTHKFFLTAWMHLRFIEKECGKEDIELQIVRRFA
jgi:hypothetical protein